MEEAYMELKISTVYTKERLLRFNDYYWMQRKAFFAFMAGCTLLIWACVAFLAFINALSETVAFCGVMVTLMDAAYLFAAFLLPRLTANKATSIGAVLDFAFKEGEMSIVAETSKESSASTVKYSAIIKVGKKDDDVYLFISKRQGYIVDISELSEIERDALKALVTSHLPARKVKWK
jgi:hypothetical protein